MTRNKKTKNKNEKVEVIVNTKPARQRSRAPKKDPRWFIGAHDVKILGQSLGGFTMGSGSAPKGARSMGHLGRSRGDDLATGPSRGNLLDAGVVCVIDDDSHEVSNQQIIEMDEMIAVINGNTSFEVTTFVVNAGLAATFPWLAQMAALYESYEVLDLAFYYKEQASAYATAGQIGKVILAFDYESLGAAPSTTKEAEAIWPHADFMPCQNGKLGLSRKKLTPSEGKFIRTGLLPAGGGATNYDAGLCHVCVSGTADTSAIGEIHVAYKVRLFNPRLPDALDLTPNYYVAEAELSGAVTLATAVDVPFTAFTVNGLGITVPAAGVFTLPPGNFFIEGFQSATATGGNITAASLYMQVDGTTDASASGTDRIDCLTGAGLTKHRNYCSLFVQVSTTTTVNLRYYNTQTAGTQAGTWKIRMSLI